MKLLLDTHIVVWLANEGPLLHPAEIESLADAESIAVSAISPWEVRLKWNLRHRSGERKGPADPVRIADWLSANGVAILDLTPVVAIATLAPPLIHSDPFDELLLIHAQQTGRRLLTRDSKLASHPVALVPA